MSTRTPYEILGVAATADESTIRAAYHRRARECHPDAGGDEEEMTAVNLAASVLLDNKARALYDATGQQQQPDPQQEALSGLVSLFKSVLEALLAAGRAPEYEDVVHLMRESLQHDIASGEQAARQAQAKAARQQRLAERLRGAPLLQRAVLHDAELQRRAAQAQLLQLDSRRAALALLADTSFEHDMGRYTMTASSGTTATQWR